MRIFIAIIVGVAIGIAAVLYYNHSREQSRLQSAGEQIKSAAESAGNALDDKLRSWKLDSESITNELARTGRIIRDKANAAGTAIKDATADARVTATIKTGLVRDPDLSVWDVHVSTTDGVVTLSGTVSSPDLISRAMKIALETDGARQVISTIQVKPKT